jgi:hypothetical protein
VVDDIKRICVATSVNGITTAHLIPIFRDRTATANGLRYLTARPSLSPFCHI